MQCVRWTPHISVAVSFSLFFHLPSFLICPISWNELANRRLRGNLFVLHSDAHPCFYSSSDLYITQWFAESVVISEESSHHTRICTFLSTYRPCRKLINGRKTIANVSNNIVPNGRDVFVYSLDPYHKNSIYLYCACFHICREANVLFCSAAGGAV